MSVDYYSCDCCDEARYEEFVAECENCGRIICDDCVVGEGDFFDDMQGENGLKKEHCPFCSGEQVHDDDLLYFALNKLGMTKEKLKKEYRNQNKEV